jgi:hypothetical protein
MESCQKEGAWLAEIHSKEEQEFVVNMAKVLYSTLFNIVKL